MSLFPTFVGAFGNKIEKNEYACLLGELKLSTSDADDGFRGKRKLLKNNWEGWDARKQTR